MSSYMESAQRIGKLLEDRIPLLRRDTAGKDFRPGGGAERIVSGVCVRYPNVFDPFSPPVDESGPIEFHVAYGGEKLFNDAVEVLKGYGIEVRVKLPGHAVLIEDEKEVKVKRITWTINFTLPQDWTL